MPALRSTNRWPGRSERSGNKTRLTKPKPLAAQKTQQIRFCENTLLMQYTFNRIRVELVWISRSPGCPIGIPYGTPGLFIFKPLGLVTKYRRDPFDRAADPGHLAGTALGTIPTGLNMNSPECNSGYGDTALPQPQRG